MESAVRIGFSLVVAGSMVLGAAQMERRWIQSLAGELWDLPGNYLRAENEYARGAKIDVETRAIAERLQRKRQIAESVRFGGLPLSAAADQFLAAAKDTPYEWDTYRKTHAHLSLRARCALLVIDDVEALLEDQQQTNAAMMGACLRGQVEGWRGQ